MHVHTLFCFTYSQFLRKGTSMTIVISFISRYISSCCWKTDKDIIISLVWWKLSQKWKYQYLAAIIHDIILSKLGRLDRGDEFINHCSRRYTLASRLVKCSPENQNWIVSCLLNFNQLQYQPCITPSVALHVYKSEQ